MALVLWAPQQKQQQRKRSARINTIIEFLDEWGYVLMRDLCSEWVAAFKKRIETRVCIKIAMLLHIGIYICSQEIFEKKRERETQNGLRAKVYYRDWGDQHRQKKKRWYLVYQSIAWKYISSIFYVLYHQNDTKELPKNYLAIVMNIHTHTQFLSAGFDKFPHIFPFL